MHRAGLEPASVRLKGGGSAFELPVHQFVLHRFLRASMARSRRQADGSRRKAEGQNRPGFCPLPTAFCLLLSMHPAGLEPATVRLRAGGTAVELRVHLLVAGYQLMVASCQEHPPRSWQLATNNWQLSPHALGRGRTFNRRFRRPELRPVELPVRDRKTSFE